MGGFPAAGPGNGPQANLNVQNDQVMRFLMQSLQRYPVGPGWRAQVEPAERLHWIKQMYVHTGWPCR